MTKPPSLATTWTPEPAEERLGHMVRLLRQEGLLAYPEWDPVPDLGQEDHPSGQT